MGYESKMIIVDKGEGWDEKPYGQIIAEFNLSCIDGFILDEINKAPDTDCYIYLDGEETTEDRYGYKLKELTLADAIRIFADATTRSDYRRYKPFLMLLMGFDSKQWDNLKILHYGY